MRLIVPLDRRSVARHLDRSRGHSPTYDGPACSDAVTAPFGYRLDRHVAPIGQGREAFERAREGLSTWQSHRFIGIAVRPRSAQVTQGATVLVLFGLPVLSVVAPCRVVEVTDESDRWAFSYRTLQGHPERGEEQFEVAIDDRGIVTCAITAVSRPASKVVGLLGPFARFVQGRVAASYVAATKRHVVRATT